MGRPDASLTDDVESAGFVRIVTRGDGDAIAAAGVLARGLSALGTPFQVTVDRTVGERTARAGDVDDRDGATVVLAIGPVDADVRRLDDDERPATLAAVDLARDLEVEPDRVLALAGTVAAGVEPGAGETEHVLETAVERGTLDRRPGVAIPTDDPADLAASTLLVAPWSGNPEALVETLEGVSEGGDDDAHRRLASLVALEAVGAEGASEGAAHAIARVLRAYRTPTGPFETLGGYADVLEVLARARPGTGVALALGHDVSGPALEAWREHALRAHRELEAASTGRYDGLSVFGVDGAVETVARLAVAYRAPEPLVLAIGDGEAAVAATGRRALAGPVEAIARDLEAEYDVSRRRGYLSYDRRVDDSEIIETVRGRL